MKFTKKDINKLYKVFASRRDVRGNNFINKKISKKKLDLIFKAALLAPSVGYSQPWRFMIVDDIKKDKVYKHVNKSFDKSKTKFKDRPIYSNLKLEGIKESNINIAVYYKKPNKDILGQTYMKKTGEYSVVCAILNMWHMARVLNIGMGWVSILKPKKINEILDVNSSEYKFVAYLCFGYTKEFYEEPELKLLNWEEKLPLEDCFLS